MGTPTTSPARLSDAYAAMRQRVAAAAERSGRPGDAVNVVAVTKYAAPDQIRQLVELGHADLGESRAQQLQQRVPQLAEYLERRDRMADVSDNKDRAAVPDKVRWHMIGQLQRNKAKQIAPLVDLIHSVDSLRLAEELQAIAGKREQQVDLLIQVNIAGETDKGGVALPAAVHLAETIDSMLDLRLRGLMCMAPYADDPEQARPVFKRCAELFSEVRKEGIGGETFNVLSMGMSGDYEVAIEEGANVVRIGSALFGDG
ncbi:MAG: YggS family pyridoxal phosphate-dependent enzyme [Planctomycetota bacterium]